MLLIVLGALALALVIGLTMVKLLKTTDISLAKVAVVVPEDDALMDYVTSFIESMDSVKSICTFEYMDEEEAISAFKSGEVDAAIVIPEGFYHDVQVGLNPPATLYFPEDPGIVGMTFKEVLISGVSYLQTAEAGVYATLDTAKVYVSDMTGTQIGTTLSLQYVNKLLSRDRVFKDKELSPLGDISLYSYYFMAGLLIILLFSGIAYSFMYEKNLRAVSDKLKVQGVGPLLNCMIKIFAMTPFIYLTSLLIYMIGVFVSDKYELQMISLKGSAFLWLLLLSFIFAIYFQLVYGITGSGRTGIFVLIILNVIGISISGLIIPQIYLSNWTVTLSYIFPERYLLTLLKYAFFGLKGGAL